MNKVSEKLIKKRMSHCRRRCLERFGFVPTIEDFDYWKYAIKNKLCTFFCRDSYRVGVYDLDYNSHELRLVWDGQRQLIITVLLRSKRHHTPNYIKRDKVISKKDMLNGD